MKLVEAIRKQGVLFQRRWDLYKYNLRIKKQIGMYNPEIEQDMVANRQLTLFDFTGGSDYFLLDPYSDASEFGGESQCELNVMEVEDPVTKEKEKFCNHNIH